jgi:signal transduction histidine kinase
VIVNLIDNSLRAAAKTISIQIVDDTEHVRVRVTDDGTGVQKEIANRIFDPFFTTREVGEGSGLGLYLSRQIARRHGGDLRLVTSDQPGACFDLRLPAYTS